MLLQERKPVLVLLLASIFLVGSISAYLVYPVSGEVEIYIRSDGSVDPSTVAIFTDDRMNYLLLDDINNSIVVERDSIVLDGEGHTIQGAGSGGTQGITLVDRSNVTIRHVTIKGFWRDIILENSSGCRISECSVTETTNVGILLDNLSTFNTIDMNNVSYNWNDGIRLSASSDFNVICGNSVMENFLAISVSNSANNTLEENNVTMNRSGLSVTSSSNTKILGNYIANGYRDASGVYLASSTSTMVADNTITNSSDGLVMLWSTHNVICRNTITQNYYGGIYLRESSNNSIYENIVSGNEGNYGISVSYCSSNSIYHNSFINNDAQILGNTLGYVNSWDVGYQSGGNYWSRHSDPDVSMEEDQSKAGSDGIVDEPLVVDAENVDRYPLTKPFDGVYDIGLRVAVSKTVVAEGYNITVSINVTIINYGLRMESFGFTSEIYGVVYDEEFTLESRHSESMFFFFSTTGLAKDNYTILASVDVVPEEIDISDNTYFGLIMITGLGDIAPAYGIVDIFDVAKIALSFGSAPGDPSWNSDADINDDALVDIFDMVAVAANFGQTS